MSLIARTEAEERRRAWEDYAEATRGLEGAAYDEAEQEAWQRLQERLEDLRDATAFRRSPLG
ncbi:MAG TPA: hypothetical protein VFR97_02125 [Capillimicrobium sp.]|nr:hypothetical protein [Capillimicrobium sp.]